MSFAKIVIGSVLGFMNEFALENDSFSLKIEAKISKSR